MGGKKESNGLKSRHNHVIKRVLIVDDEKCILDLFKTIVAMSFSDMEIDVAQDGLQAVEWFKKKHHELLLMDIHMPNMDGISAYHKIHQLCQDEMCDMPGVIFCTGFAPPDKMRRILAENSNNGFLPKPISPDALIGAIKTSMAV